MSTQIVIAGASLSGMLTALSLANFGIPSLILINGDLAVIKDIHDQRSTALTNHSQIYLNKIGLWNSITEHVGPINDIYVVDNKAPQMLHFTLDDANDKMGYLIENKSLRCSLLKACQQQNLISFLPVQHWQATNRATHCQIDYQTDGRTQTIAADLLLLCNGRQQPTYWRYFAQAYEKTYPQTAITFIVKHQIAHEGTAVEHFMSHGPFAILPLQDAHQSSIVWVVPHGVSELLLKLPIAKLTSLVQENFGEFLGVVQILSAPQAFKLKAYHATNYYNRHIGLLADTAHVIHPLAGQGLNQGIKDIEALTLNIIKHGPSIKALQNYQEQRWYDNEAMLQITDNLNRLFSNSSLLLHLTRQAGFSLINHKPIINQALVKYAMGKR